MGTGLTSFRLTVEAAAGLQHTEDSARYRADAQDLSFNRKNLLYLGHAG
jgi:hypothetical protein